MQYFANLNENNIIDNRKFWQTVKPFLSGKKIKGKNNLEKIISADVEVGNNLNTFFSKLVKILNILEKIADNNLPYGLSRHATLNGILKYKDHPSIRIIERVSQRFSSFYFSPVDENTVPNKIRNLKSNKTLKDTDIPVKILILNAEFFAEYIYL